ncbi:hypothetical protein [Listeria valentina]|uniref:hypothetical protein n=1 Tax=Listeria valentina TaxID=2705293 RepID=UPI0014301ABC|nr:hypothetical protein [Listeria valentina]
MVKYLSLFSYLILGLGALGMGLLFYLHIVDFETSAISLLVYVVIANLIKD